MTSSGSLAWWNEQLPPASRAVGTVQYALQQIDGLLDYVTGQRHIAPDVVANACVESFMVNVRLVADFLIKGHETKDLRAVDLLPGWESTGEAGERLAEWWDLASKHVMHMSRMRIPEELGAMQPLTETEFRQMAADCREVYQAFAAQYDTAP
ncbi:hypothetical protein A8W25_19235 [Streptomyces sp. ERV7]|uniref:hypothetical protein n=1 Tax=Streptomyces sp. ERV7 TaxID=1322334 RepID=UPI0007F42C37|nr:hypothetical protein [Streptomyces sp. ERV7]OAR24527.1 hypothetical protein A8W25_19235 [Streptomyces sp. ERV7]